MWDLIVSVPDHCLSFYLLPLVNCHQFMYYFPFGFEGRMWDLIVSVPGHCLSFSFLPLTLSVKCNKWYPLKQSRSCRVSTIGIISQM